MKLRLMPVLVSVIVSAVLLFGGYFTYKSVAMENPLQDIVTSIEGVEIVSVKLSSTQALVDVKLSRETSLREVYQTIDKEAAAVLDERKLELTLHEKTFPELEAWWSPVLFDVAQAMETRHYSEIPTALQSRADADSHVTALTEMDNTNVYITLKSGEAVKHIILPRTPATLEVWSSE